MTDILYRLVVDMSTRGSLNADTEKLGKSGGKLKDVFGGLKESVSGIAGGLSDAFTGAVEKAGALAAGIAKVGAVAAGGAIAYGVVHLNAELEKTQISLAAILNAQGMSGGITDALSKSSTIIKDMRKDAAQLPGEFKDLLGFFRLGATPGFQSGASIQQMEKLSANAMAAAAATGVNMEQAGREFAQLLQGHAGGHNVFGSLIGLSGASAQKFNKSTGDERVKTLEKELGKFQPAIEVFGSSFDALSSTMLDNAKRFLGTATAGLFDRAKIAMIDANAWWDKHEGSALGFAEKIGEKLNYAFDVGRRKIEEWWHPFLTFIGNAEDRLVAMWERVSPYVERIGSGLKDALADPGTFDKLEGVLKLYAGVKIGGMAAPAIGPILSGLGSAAGGGAAAGGIGALIVGLLAADVAASAHVLTDETSSMHQSATEHWASMKAHFGGMLYNFEVALERLEPVGTRIADLYGNWVVGQLDRAASALEAFSNVVAHVADAIDGVEGQFTKLEKIVNHFSGLTIRSLNDDDPSFGVDHAPQILMSLKTIAGTAKDFDETKAKGNKQVHGGGGTTIHKVEIVVSSNQDPSRIARATVDKLADMARNPTSSRYTRNWSAARP